MARPNPIELEPALGILGYLPPHWCPPFDKTGNLYTGIFQTLDKAVSFQYAQSSKRPENVAFIKFHEGLYRFMVQDFSSAINSFLTSRIQGRAARYSENKDFLVCLGSLALGLVYHHDNNFEDANNCYNEVGETLNQLRYNIDNRTMHYSPEQETQLNNFYDHAHPILNSAQEILGGDINKILQRTRRLQTTEVSSPSVDRKRSEVLFKIEADHLWAKNILNRQLIKLERAGETLRISALPIARILEEQDNIFNEIDKFDTDIINYRKILRMARSMSRITELEKDWDRNIEAFKLRWQAVIDNL